MAPLLFCLIGPSRRHGCGWDTATTAHSAAAACWRRGSRPARAGEFGRERELSRVVLTPVHCCRPVLFEVVLHGGSRGRPVLLTLCVAAANCCCRHCRRAPVLGSCQFAACRAWFGGPPSMHAPCQTSHGTGAVSASTPGASIIIYEGVHLLLRSRCRVITCVLRPCAGALGWCGRVGHRQRVPAAHQRGERPCASGHWLRGPCRCAAVWVWVVVGGGCCVQLAGAGVAAGLCPVLSQHLDKRSAQQHTFVHGLHK